MPRWWTQLSPLAKGLSIVAILIGMALIAVASWQHAQSAPDHAPLIKR
jgi:hypothetical protein